MADVAVVEEDTASGEVVVMVDYIMVVVVVVDVEGEVEDMFIVPHLLPGDLRHMMTQMKNGIPFLLATTKS